MFEIIVDSAANIPAELCKKYKIKVLSFVNLVNGKEMTCFEPDLTPEQERAKGKEYYDAIREGAEVKTGLISKESKGANTSNTTVTTNSSLVGCIGFFKPPIGVSSRSI